MITDDQIAELFAQANPVPTLETSDRDLAVDDGTRDETPEGSSGMTTVKTRDNETTRRRRPLVAAGLAAVLAAVVAVPLLLTDGEQTEVATTPEEVAVQTAEDLFAALSDGDAAAASMLLEPEVLEAPGNRQALEFFAALPGTKTLSDCTTRSGSGGAVTVECTTNYNGPLMSAVGEDSIGTFTVKDGLLTTMFNPGQRDETASAFAEYASQTGPGIYERDCSAESYEPGSVRTQSSGFVFAGPCGSLWWEMADDAAAWVEAGKPPLSAEEAALATVDEFVEALTVGDGEGAVVFLGAEQEEDPVRVNSVAFLAALPGSKTLSDCSALEGSGTVNLSCTLTIAGPLFQATGTDSVRASFTMEEGQIVSFVPGGRDAADVAFVEYATETQPDRYSQVCSPDAYEPNSVRVNGDGYVFAGACGELWAEVADDAATWVEAGKPTLTEDG